MTFANTQSSSTGSYLPALMIADETLNAMRAKKDDTAVQMQVAGTDKLRSLIRAMAAQESASQEDNASALASLVAKQGGLGSLAAKFASLSVDAPVEDSLDFGDIYGRRLAS